MFVHEAPFLGAVNGAAKLRHEAVRLQCYADVNPGSKPDVLAFWEAQKALADVDHGLPYDGTWVPGALDLRPSCYKVLSHYRLFNTAGLADYKEFCQFFIEKNGGAPANPLVLTKDLPASLSVTEGTNELFLEITASGGKPPYTYAWYKGASKLGSTGTSYGPVPSAATSHAGNYRAEVTDSAGTVVKSTTCVVTVNAALSTLSALSEESAEEVEAAPKKRTLRRKTTTTEE